MDVLESYKGSFTLGADSNLTVTLDRDTTWTHTLEKLDPMQNGLGTLRTTSSGALTFKNGFNNSNFRLDAQNAGGVFTRNATLGALATQTHHTVDGMLTIANDFVANEGNRFALTVQTGVKQDGAIDNVAHWALGRNGNSGIHVNGKASGTVNFAITTHGSSQEERIAIFAANQIDEENFDVQLVDAMGNKISGLEIGGYDYTLVRKDRVNQGKTPGAGTDIFLSSIPDARDQRNTTVNAGSYVSIATAAQLLDLSLHDRMSNRSWLTTDADGSVKNAFWVIENVSHERFNDSTSQIDIHNTASTTTLGSDIMSYVTNSGTWYAGVMFGYANQDAKSRSMRTALESRADTNAWSVGLYTGWQENPVSRLGGYVDAWMMYTDAESDIKGNNVQETVSGSGLSASIEAGYAIHAFDYNSNGQAGSVYLEPHASATWFGYQADAIHNATHDVTFEGDGNIRTRLGVKAFAFTQTGNAFSPFLEVNWVHNTKPYAVRISDIRVEQAGATDLGEIRTGMDWQINAQWTAWAHFGVAVGTDSYNEREGSLGLRYQF